VSVFWLLLIGFVAAVIAIVWFFFMAPLEKEMHERRMELIRKKIEKREQSLRERSDGDKN
jgi:hypothetical protein